MLCGEEERVPASCFRICICDFKIFIAFLQGGVSAVEAVSRRWIVFFIQHCWMLRNAKNEHSVPSFDLFETDRARGCTFWNLHSALLVLGHFRSSRADGNLYQPWKAKFKWKYSFFIKLCWLDISCHVCVAFQKVSRIILFHLFLV